MKNYATTNATGKPLDKESLFTAIAMLKNMPPQEEIIASAGCGKDYLKALRETTQLINRCVTDKPMLGSFGGFDVFQDDELPPDTIEFRNKDGAVLYAATLTK